MNNPDSVNKMAKKPDNSKAVYVTLVLLVLFVVGVFCLTILKFMKVW